MLQREIVLLLVNLMHYQTFTPQLPLKNKSPLSRHQPLCIPSTQNRAVRRCRLASWLAVYRLLPAAYNLQPRPDMVWRAAALAVCALACMIQMCLLYELYELYVLLPPLCPFSSNSSFAATTSSK